MPKKTAQSEAVATRQSSRKRKVPDRYDEYVSNRAAPDSPEPRSRSNSPVSRKKNSKKKYESESEDDVAPSDVSDEEVEEESEVEESEQESDASDSDNDKKKKSRGRGASKSKGSAKTTKSKGSKSSSSKKSFVSKLDDNVKDELEGLNVDELKERLKENDQISTGTKGELQERIAECITDGGFPRCPKCGLGKIKKDSKGYFCPGGYDDDKYKKCSWKGKSVDRPKWKTAKGQLV